MPTPRKYQSATERKAAYRARSRAALQTLLAQKGFPTASPIPTIPSYPRWEAMIRNARALLENVRDEMHSYSADRSEAWQESERAESFAQVLEALEDALDALDNAPSFGQNR